MGQVIHGSAKTTHAVRAELQRSQASAAELARRYGLNEKTVRKWRSRQSVEDQPMGPKERRSSVLSAIEEAAIVALRVQARLPLDDVFIALKDVIPHLTRSSLHRCLQRHGISRLPNADREKPERFKAYEIGYFHIDIAELRHEGGKAYLFVAVDRTSKLVFARIYRKATKLVAAGFLKALANAVPYRIHTVLTEDRTRYSGNRGPGWLQHAQQLFPRLRPLVRMITTDLPKDRRAKRSKISRCGAIWANRLSLQVYHGSQPVAPLRPSSETGAKR